MSTENRKKETNLVDQYREWKKMKRMKESIVYRWRAVKGISQQVAAYILGYSSSGTISRWETGEKAVPARVLAYIQLDLGINDRIFEMLMGGDRSLPEQAEV